VALAAVIGVVSATTLYLGDHFRIFYHKPSFLLDSKVLENPQIVSPDCQWVSFILWSTFCAVFITLFRHWVKEHLLGPLCSKFGFQRRRKSREKFKEQFWLLLYYTGVFIIEYLALNGRSWWSPSIPHSTRTALWVGWPQKEDHSIGIIFFLYCFQTGFYIHLLVELFRDKESHRTDFWQYFIHHLSAFLLLVFSWGNYFQRIGTLVLALHDFSDIFLALTKSLHYLRMWENGKNVAFVLFASSFAWTRLYLLPILTWSASYESEVVVRSTAPFVALVLVILLLCLITVHVFWFVLILRMVYGLLLVKRLKKDIRSSSDEDEPHPHA